VPAEVGSGLGRGGVLVKQQDFGRLGRDADRIMARIDTTAINQ
jgi:hypothetical protein